jgi:hypothetical protein
VSLIVPLYSTSFTSSIGWFCTILIAINEI